MKTFTLIFMLRGFGIITLDFPDLESCKHAAAQLVAVVQEAAPATGRGIYTCMERHVQSPVSSPKP